MCGSFCNSLNIKMYFYFPPAAAAALRDEKNRCGGCNPTYSATLFGAAQQMVEGQPAVQGKSKGVRVN
jgi:hypothetical protein